jgi:hypothetical protein
VFCTSEMVLATDLCCRTNMAVSVALMLGTHRLVAYLSALVLELLELHLLVASISLCVPHLSFRSIF